MAQATAQGGGPFASIAPSTRSTKDKEHSSPEQIKGSFGPTPLLLYFRWKGGVGGGTGEKGGRQTGTPADSAMRKCNTHSNLWGVENKHVGLFCFPNPLRQLRMDQD